MEPAPDNRKCPSILPTTTVSLVLCSHKKWHDMKLRVRVVASLDGARLALHSTFQLIRIRFPQFTVCTFYPGTKFCSVLLEFDSLPRCTQGR